MQFTSGTISDKQIEVQTMSLVSKNSGELYASQDWVFQKSQVVLQSYKLTLQMKFILYLYLDIKQDSQIIHV